MIDELLKSLKKALNILEWSATVFLTEMRFLNKSVKRILEKKVFMENYNKFLTSQIDIEINE